MKLGVWLKRVSWMILCIEFFNDFDVRIGVVVDGGGVVIRRWWCFFFFFERMMMRWLFVDFYECLRRWCKIWRRRWNLFFGFGLSNFLTQHLKRHINVVCHVTRCHAILRLPRTYFCNRWWRHGSKPKHIYLTMFVLEQKKKIHVRK